MQYIIEIKPDQDLQFLLTFLQKMQVVYRPIDMPAEVEKEPKNLGKSANIADKYIGKMSDETAHTMLEYLKQSRNEWERAI